MKNTISAYVASFADMRRDKRKFTVALCILAFFVVLAVTWSFKLVGISIAGDANVSDSKADVETSAEWEATLPALGEDWGENAASIAKSQVGYTESKLNFIMADDGETRQGYTRYGEWFGSAYNDWDAMFASFCLHYAGVPQATFPRSLGAYSWVSDLKKANLYKAGGDLAASAPGSDEVSQAQQAGNLLFLDTKGDGRADTVAVITAADGTGAVTVVQGDADHKVKQYRINALTDSLVFGYGLVPQNPAQAQKEAQQKEQAKAEAAKAERSKAQEAAADKAKEESKSTGAASSKGESDSDPNDKAKAAADEKSAESEQPAKDGADIAVCAQWEGDAGAKSLKMTLVANGDADNPVDTITLSAKDNWQDAFTDVPLTDKKGRAIAYSVVPAAAKNFDTAADVKTLSAQAFADAGDSKDGAVSPEALTALAQADADSDEAKAAEVQPVSENVVSATSEGGDLSPSRTALYAFTYTPAVYADSSSQRVATPTVPLTITKDWSDGDANSHAGDTVTVDVRVKYEDDSVQNITTTISASDSWKKVVNVPANISIESCTVTERAMDGYDSYVEPVNIVASDVWIPVQPNNVKANETYAIVYQSNYGGTNYTLADGGYGALTSETANKGTGTVVYDNVAYYDYLTTVSEYSQWQWVVPSNSAYSGRYLLYNAKTKGYVLETSSRNYTAYGYYDVYGYKSSTSGGTSFQYGSNKTLMSSSSHYMVGSSSAAATTSGATAYTFYKKIRATSSMSTTVHNRKTAAETESATSVSVSKEWGDGAAKHANDSVTLHLTNVDKGGQRVAGAAPVTLSAKNGWKANDVWQNLAEGTYSIEEDAVAGYNATVESSQTRKTIWIPVDEFEEGEIYAIADSGGGKYLQAPDQAANSASVSYGPLKSIASATSVKTQTGSFKFGGKTYTGYLNDADVPIGAQWTAVKAGSGHKLRSSSMNGAEAGYWMHLMGTTEAYPNVLYAGGAASIFTYNATNDALYESTRTSYPLGSASGYSSYYGYNGSTYRKMQLYKRITLIDRVFTVKNAPASAASVDDSLDVEHNKYLDALRDGDRNPDTSLPAGTDLTDLYRLYLDAGPVDFKEPIDLLLVLDDSGSMKETTSLNGISMTRTKALQTILTDSNNGVIPKFLKANAQNRVAVVKFAGATPIYSTSYAKDATRLSGWTSTTPSLDGLASSGGTNYSAGLLEAQKLFTTARSTSKKVMVFLSDGVPTFYVDANGVRHGHGWSDRGNAVSCIEPSKDSFDRFQAACPGVTTYSIGFSEQATGNTGDASTSPAVLRYYAEEGDGSFIQAKEADVLSDQLSKLILGGGLFTDASISDALSDAVDLYSPKPDYKVVMEKLVDGKVSGNPVVLFANGTAQKTFDDDAAGGQAKDIVTGVSYDEATRTVTALFDPHYAMDPEYRYTVSFNVKTTNKAYTDYANDKSKGGDGYDGMRGDAKTDYTPYQDESTNKTSSGELGFRSNTSAQLNFKRGNSYYAMAYQHPVIQVGDCSFQIRKVDADNRNKLLSGARFSVYRKAHGDEPVSEVAGLDGKYFQVATDLRTVNGVVSLTDLEPDTYWVVEDMAPEGYTRDGNPHEIILSRDAIVVAPGDRTVTYQGNENGTLVLEYINKQGYLLPYTGGPGDDLFRAVGVSLLAIAVAIRCVMARRKTRGGSGVPPC